MSSIAETALIINEKEWEMMCALDPHFKELSFEENQGNYLVFNLDAETRWAILTPGTFHQYFERIENSNSIPTYKFIRK